MDEGALKPEFLSEDRAGYMCTYMNGHDHVQGQRVKRKERHRSWKMDILKGGGIDK